MEKCDGKSEFNGRGGTVDSKTEQREKLCPGEESGGGRARGSSRRTTAIEERQ